MAPQVMEPRRGMTDYTKFEPDLIDWFIDHSGDLALANQLRSATLDSRKYTGAGLYINLKVPESAASQIPSTVASPTTGPEISSPLLTNGAGSLLFHKHETVECVEVY